MLNNRKTYTLIHSHTLSLSHNSTDERSHRCFSCSLSENLNLTNIPLRTQFYFVLLYNTLSFLLIFLFFSNTKVKPIISLKIVFLFYSVGFKEKSLGIMFWNNKRIVFFISFLICNLQMVFRFHLKNLNSFRFYAF